jgi:serine phosphatase RsbU (regulator of sigma subunit)
MRVLVKEGDAVLADLSFEEEEIVVGSQPGCSIHLPDARVSPRQATISPTDDHKWRIENVDPANPIQLNSAVVTAPAVLANDDEITLHDYLLKVYTDAALEQHVREDGLLGPEDLAKIKKFPLPPGAVMRRSFEPVTMVRSELDQFSSLSMEVCTARDLHELVDIALRELLRAFNARAAWIGLRRKTEGELEIQAGRLPSGQSCGINQYVQLLQYRCVDRLQHICLRKIRDDAEIGSAMGVPLPLRNGALGMIYVDRQVGAKRFQIPDLDLLSMFGAQVAARAEAIVEQRLQRNAAVSATEVSVVHSIQMLLDPRSVPNFRDLQLAAYSRSGQENPGDIYDVMKHPDTEITAFLLGHVAATGANLALSMARLHSTFRVGVLHNDPPHALARTLNWLMYNEKDPSNIHALFLVVDPPSGKLKFCRAGKIGAFVLNAQGQPRPLPGADAPPIGQVRSYEYLSHMEQLAPNETLAMYSRGVATATNATGERFGEKRFIELVCDGFCQPPANTIQDLTADLNSFFAEGKHPDDITIALLHREG